MFSMKKSQKHEASLKGVGKIKGRPLTLKTFQNGRRRADDPARRWQAVPQDGPCLLSPFSQACCIHTVALPTTATHMLF